MKSLVVAAIAGLLACGQPTPREQIEQLLSRKDLTQSTKVVELPDNAGYMFMAKFGADLTDVQLVYMMGGLLNYLGSQRVHVRGKVVVYAVEMPSRAASVTADYVSNELEIWYTMNDNADVYTKKIYRGNIALTIDQIVDGSAPDPSIETGKVADEFPRRGKREAA